MNPPLSAESRRIIAVALAMVEESRERLDRATPAERASLEREARDIIQTDHRARLSREAAGIGTRDLFGVSADEYRGTDGTTMRREYGETPNGNPYDGRWVLRNPTGALISFDQYRNDIAEEYGLRLLPPN